MRTLEKDAETEVSPLAGIKYGVMPSRMRPPANEKDAVHVHAAVPLTKSVFRPAEFRTQAM